MAKCLENVIGFEFKRYPHQYCGNQYRVTLPPGDPFTSKGHMSVHRMRRGNKINTSVPFESIKFFVVPFFWLTDEK